MAPFERERSRLEALAKEGVKTDPQTGLPLFLIMPGISWEDPEVDDDYFWDGQVAKETVQTLDRVKDRPFFLYAGFI